MFHPFIRFVRLPESCVGLLLATALLSAPTTLTAADGLPKGHPLPTPANRPLAEGPARFVDAQKGDDAADGSQQRPWKTLQHAIAQLQPGETLYLRGGVYYENAYCAVAGKESAPITIRSYPGELAAIDGGLPEFFQSPETAWEPAPNASPDEYRSKRRYPNLRNVLGSFGESMVGLNTYFHAQDLRAKSEVWDWDDPAKSRETDARPLYCGPGVWYDAASGYIHARLSHTHLPEIENYQGPTDPRQVKLVLAGFRSVPLFLDRARHLRLQDLVIRGGGYDTVVIDYGEDVEFDNVTIYCGTYGMRCSQTGPLRVLRTAMHGNCAPWLFRGDTSKRAYPGRPFRDITRLNTHSHWVIDAGREFSVFAHPMNDHWEVAHCHFTDAHDGPYFGGVNLRFHHNLVENTQDDGLYLSQMYPRHIYMGGGAEIHIYQNVFRRCLTALAFGGTEDTRDRIFIYRNLVDLRDAVQTGRPSTARPTISTTFGKLMGDHGGPPWPEMNIYQNTFVMRGGYNRNAMSTLGATSAERPRRVFNNVFLSLAPMPGYPALNGAHRIEADGNLFWSPENGPSLAENYFDRFRRSPVFEALKAGYPAGVSSHSLVADPRFQHVEAEGAVSNDYRLQAGSPAIDAGVKLPADWPDPLREQDRGAPDIGALPLDAAMFEVGP